ncbi:hypothetical protein LF844_13045 [Metapseudomonas lalkuanensis]|uniref:hypothetical protein n=1 Tax=Metapseudomonas lalkuanensis TaxID=2604832 RepID=UPI001CF13C8E|nr:hypothetical protein [Pseudomonas lalkuanensis]UCP00687.1 hypothetical protein LF844_13045 [Pseudomonas lalkuanensis]
MNTVLQAALPESKKIPLLPIATPLTEWQDVSISELAPCAPSDSTLPMGQYAVSTVMNWAIQQGFYGAIPTWEIGNGTWGVICFRPHPELQVVKIPVTDLGGYDPTSPQSCGQAVMRWAQLEENGSNQLAIPTYLNDDDEFFSALVFTPNYPTLTFYDAPNTQLYFSLQQPAKLINLQDPAVWANAAMRVANNLGFAAGWPTWECTTHRGLIGIPAYDLGPMPDACPANVATVVEVLHKTSQALQNFENVSSSLTSGVFIDFTAAPIADPTMQILSDCLFGAVQACLNAIPGVGGTLAALVSSGVQIAIDATNSSGGTFSLEQYQKMLVAASNATIDYVADLHDSLQNATGDDLQKLWQSPYKDPLSGRSIALGSLACTPPDIVNGDLFWAKMSQHMEASYRENLQIRITAQLYGIQSRTYHNRAPGKQWWDGTIASVTAPGGDCSQYIASSDSDLSVWFSGALQVGDYVELDEWWMQALPGNPYYPPTTLVYNLFSNDGFGVTTNWAGPFTKEQFYTQFFVQQNQVGLDGTYNQVWMYDQPNAIVEARLSENLVAGSTDNYGNLSLNSSDPLVILANSECEFSQPVITNYLAPLTS